MGDSAPASPVRSAFGQNRARYSFSVSAGGTALDLGGTDGYFSSLPPEQIDLSALLFASIHGSIRTSSYEEFFSGQVTTLSLQNISAVPLPAAAWFFGSALFAMLGLSKPKGALVESTPGPAAT